MPQTSAGILAYRTVTGALEVLLAHPGGPFWAKRDEWTIPKGLFEDGETAEDAARREFAEEIGQLIPDGIELIDLGVIRQPSGKYVHIYATHFDMDVSNVTSNLFEMEWPPHSGKTQSFPEIECAEWFTLDEAAEKIMKGQLGFLGKLEDALG